jgi:hypothetical protein
VIDRIKPEEDRLVIELRPGEPIASLLSVVHNIRHIEIQDEADRRVVQLETPDVDEALVARLSDLDYVVGVRWRR